VRRPDRIVTRMGAALFMTPFCVGVSRSVSDDVSKLTATFQSVEAAVEALRLRLGAAETALSSFAAAQAVAQALAEGAEEEAAIAAAGAVASTKGWKEAMDEQGQRYFIHESTGETSWDPPVADPSAAALAVELARTAREEKAAKAIEAAAAAERASITARDEQLKATVAHHVGAAVHGLAETLRVRALEREKAATAEVLEKLDSVSSAVDGKLVTLREALKTEVKQDIQREVAAASATAVATVAAAVAAKHESQLAPKEVAIKEVAILRPPPALPLLAPAAPSGVDRTMAASPPGATAKASLLSTQRELDIDTVACIEARLEAKLVLRMTEAVCAAVADAMASGASPARGSGASALVPDTASAPAPGTVPLDSAPLEGREVALSASPPAADLAVEPARGAEAREEALQKGPLIELVNRVEEDIGRFSERIAALEAAQLASPDTSPLRATASSPPKPVALGSPGVVPRGSDVATLRAELDEERSRRAAVERRLSALEAALDLDGSEWRATLALVNHDLGPEAALADPDVNLLDDLSVLAEAGSTAIVRDAPVIRRAPASQFDALLRGIFPPMAP